MSYPSDIPVAKQTVTPSLSQDIVSSWVRGPILEALRSVTELTDSVAIQEAIVTIFSEPQRYWTEFCNDLGLDALYANQVSFESWLNDLEAVYVQQELATKELLEYARQLVREGAAQPPFIGALRTRHE